MSVWWRRIKEKIGPRRRDDAIDPKRVSLAPLYVGNTAALVVGLANVLILNLATPLDVFYLRRPILMSDPVAALTFASAFAPLLAGVIGLILVVQRALMRPIAAALTRLRAGERPPGELLETARRRLINLPYHLAGVNLAIWVALPTLVAAVVYLAGVMELRTAIGVAARTSMVGLIASAVSWFVIEDLSRHRLIPLFFPKGGLARVKGAFRIPISRRILFLYTGGTLMPLLILIITLLLLQSELGSSPITAREYGREILVFTLVLGVMFFIVARALNRRVAHSIREPVEYMLDVIARIEAGDYEARIRVVGNDELGRLGDAGNAMIRGLADREKIRTTFGKYVTPEIRDEILSGRIPANGERRVATVMFADLRGFTSFVENNSTEEIILGLRAYFTAMHRVIRRYRGLVLQFVGDEIEAVFGVPVPFEDHADMAVQAAREMRRALAELNRERRAQGRPPFAHGVGIHTGPVLAGNSGSEDQLSYALIGSTVNVASRIQGLTKELGWDILASAQTVSALYGDYRTEELPPRLVKGYSKPVTVYKILE